MISPPKQKLNYNKSIKAICKLHTSYSLIAGSARTLIPTYIFKISLFFFFRYSHPAYYIFNVNIFDFLINHNLYLSGYTFSIIYEFSCILFRSKAFMILAEISDNLRFGVVTIDSYQ
jgi:hypothetical protein